MRTLFIRTNRGVQLTSRERNFIIMYLLPWSDFCSEEALSENDGLLYGGNIVIGTSETALNIFCGSIKKFSSELPRNPFKNLYYSTPQALRRSEAVKLILLRYRHRGNSGTAEGDFTGLFFRHTCGRQNLWNI